MTTRQTTGFGESLIGLDWDVPDFSTLGRRQKNLAVNIPHRGSQGPLHLLIDIEPLNATGSRAVPNDTTAEAASKPRCIV